MAGTSPAMTLQLLLQNNEAGNFSP